MTGNTLRPKSLTDSAPLIKESIVSDAHKEASPPQVKTSKKDVYVVAKGKAITSLKGIRASGDEVKSSDFKGGKTTFNDLIDKGFIVKG